MEHVRSLWRVELMNLTKSFDSVECRKFAKRMEFSGVFELALRNIQVVSDM